MKSKVAIHHLDTYGESEIEEGLRGLLTNLGGIEALIPSRTRKVLVKPNLVFPYSWDTGITVNLTLIAKLVQVIKRAGIEVIIGEGGGLEKFGRESLKKVGAEKLAKELGVPLYDFKKGKRVKVKIAKGKKVKSVTVDRVVTECDFIISVAKLKTHCECLVSLSLKNMKGLLCSEKQRLRFHLLDVNHCLVDLNRVFKPKLAIVEGLIGLEGIGPLPPGRPVDLGLLIGGQDPVAVDAVCAKIMRLEPDQVKHIKLAAEAGLGTIDLGKIEIVGEKLEDVIPEHFETPPSSIEGISPYEKIQIVAGKPCSNCVIGLASYLHGYFPKELIEQATSEVRVLVGAKARIKGTGNEIAIGNCLRRYKGKLPYISGCPPASDHYGSLIEDGLRGKFIVNRDMVRSALDRFFQEP